MLTLSKPTWYDLEGLGAPVRVKLSSYNLMVSIASTPDIDFDPDKPRTVRQINEILFEQAATEFELMLLEWEGILMPDGTPAETTSDNIRRLLVGTPRAYPAVRDVLEKHKAPWTDEKKEFEKPSNGRRRAVQATAPPAKPRGRRARAGNGVRTAKSAPSSSIDQEA